MGKKDKHNLVVQAEHDVIAEVTKKVYRMLGTSQRLQLIQEKLPTKPLFCTAQISKILKDAGIQENLRG